MKVYKENGVWHYDHSNVINLVPGRRTIIQPGIFFIEGQPLTYDFYTNIDIDGDTHSGGDHYFNGFAEWLNTAHHDFDGLCDVTYSIANGFLPKLALYICCINRSTASVQSDWYDVKVAFACGYKIGTREYAAQLYDDYLCYRSGRWFCDRGPRPGVTQEGWASQLFSGASGGPGDWNGCYRVIESFQASSTAEANVIYHAYIQHINDTVRYPRWIEPNVGQGYSQGEDLWIWLHNDQGWEEEDLPVDTRWTKPRSMLSMINAYTMTDAQMETFKKCLWYMDGNGMELSNKLYSNPMDCIIGAFFIPFEIPVGQVTSPDIVWAGLQNLKFYDTMEKEAVFPQITDEFVEYTLGVVNIERVFNDYRDFTEVSLALYLPCIGWKTLDAQTWMGYDMKIKYRINFLTGEVIALIIMSDDDIIIDTCKGQCAQQVPISGRDFTNLMQAKLQKQGAFMAAASGFAAGALATVGGVVTANPLVASGGIAGMAGSVANGIRSGKAADVAVSKAENQVVRDGDIGGSSAIMGYPKAFVLKSYHLDAMPQGYQSYEGYQANQILTVSSLTGYIKAREVYFSSARATEAEKSMVEDLLKGGVFR